MTDKQPATASNAVLAKQVSSLVAEFAELKSQNDAILTIITETQAKLLEMQTMMADAAKKRATGGKSAAASSSAPTDQFEVSNKATAMTKNAWFAAQVKESGGDNAFVKKMPTRYGVDYKTELGSAATAAAISKAHTAIIKKIAAFKDGDKAALAKNFEDDYAAYKASVIATNSTPLDA